MSTARRPRTSRAFTRLVDRRSPSRPAATGPASTSFCHCDWIIALGIVSEFEQTGRNQIYFSFAGIIAWRLELSDEETSRDLILHLVLIEGF